MQASSADQMDLARKILEILTLIQISEPTTLLRESFSTTIPTIALRKLSICFAQLMSKEGEEIMKNKHPELWRWFLRNESFVLGGRPLGPFGTWKTTKLDKAISLITGTYEAKTWAAESVFLGIKGALLKMWHMPLGFLSYEHLCQPGMPWENIMGFVEQILKTGMRLMTTQQGLIGMAHIQARPGDRVAKIMGSQSPLIIREQSNGAYIIVGEAMEYRGIKMAKSESELQDIFII